MSTMREQVIEWVNQYKIIAIVRGIGSDKLLKVAQALYDGGIRLMEITYDQKDPSSWQTTADSIHTIRKAFAGKMRVGAGTVTSVELVEMTAKAGGEYIISPDTNIDVIRRTCDLGLVSMPGAMTPSEILTAHLAGADYVKVFPVTCMGSDYLKAVRAPLGHIKMMAVGGINENNMKEYLAAGVSGFGVGGNLANRKWIDAGEYDKLTKVARAMVAAVAAAE